MSDETESNKTNETEKESTSQGNSEFGKKVMDYFDKGLKASYKGLKNAGVVLSEFGDKSVIKIDISKLRSKLEKLYREIGKLTTDKLLSNESDAITKDTEEISDKIAEVAEIKNKIRAKEEELSQFEK